MGWYQIPTPEEVKKNKLNRGATWEDLYAGWTCQKCGKALQPGDRYFVLNDGFEHVDCHEYE